MIIIILIAEIFVDQNFANPFKNLYCGFNFCNILPFGCVNQVADFIFVNFKAQKLEENSGLQKFSAIWVSFVIA